MDITELKRADRDRALLAAIVESSDDAIVSKTLDGIITSWNAGAERLLGYTAAEVIGQPVLILIPPDRHDEEQVILGRVRRGERVEHFETVRMTKDGRALDVSLTISPLRSSDGRIVGASKILRDITASKRVEAVLRESEARFRAMTDSAPMLVWMADAAGRRTYVNERWLAFTGRKMEQELGDGWAEGVHPDDLDRCLDAFTSHFDRREPVEMEYRLCHHGGQYRWIVDRGVPRLAPDGTFLGYIGSCIDIHVRRRAEMHTRYLAETGTLVEQALDHEATLQQIARLAVPGFADWCAVDLLHDDGAISALAIAHADPEKVRWGWELRERAPVDPDAPTGVPNVIRTGRPELYAHIPDALLVEAARDEEHLRLMREIGLSSVVVVPMRVGGEVAGALTFVNAESGRRFDEADLEVAEELGRRAGAAIENARLHEALGESEAHFRLLAEALPDIAYTSTGEGLPDYVNARWAEYTGVTVQGSFLEDPTIAIHPEDRDGIAEGWARAKAAGEALEAEFRLRRHDGVYRWFLTRAVPVRDAAGRVVRWFGTSTDIHLLKSAEAELGARVAERTAELARSNDELDQFAYVASHDLKAPLRAIDNLAAWIAEDAGAVLPEESKRHLDLLQGRVRRMEHLLSDLLAYSRAGREEGAAEEVDAAALIREVVELLGSPPGMEVVVEALPRLVTYRAPLEMVFRNLIGNALKHHDRPKGRIVVRAREADDFVTFTVSDDGPGIPARYHERVFGLFQTLRPRDEVEGSGMGLAVVKKAVESRGGTIRVDSAEGQGTTFTFTWPVRA